MSRLGVQPLNGALKFREGWHCRQWLDQPWLFQPQDRVVLSESSSPRNASVEKNECISVSIVSITPRQRWCLTVSIGLECQQAVCPVALGPTLKGRKAK